MVKDIQQSQSLAILGYIALLAILGYFMFQAWVGEVEHTFVTALATTALVLVTCYYAYQSRRYARHSKDTLEEMRKTREKRGVQFVIGKGIDPILSTFCSHNWDFPQKVDNGYQPHKHTKTFFTPEKNLLLDLEDQHHGIIDEIYEYGRSLENYSDLQLEVWKELIMQLARDIEDLNEDCIEKQAIDVDLAPIFEDEINVSRKNKIGKVLPGLANAIIGIPDSDEIEEDGVKQIWEARKDHYLKYRENGELADYFEMLDQQFIQTKEKNQHLINEIRKIREQYKQEYGLTEAEILEVTGDTNIEGSVIAEVI